MQTRAKAGIFLTLSILGSGVVSSAEESRKVVASGYWTEGRPLYLQHHWDKNLLRGHLGGRWIPDASDAPEVGAGRVAVAPRRSWNMTGVLSDQNQSGHALICDDPTVPVLLERGVRKLVYGLERRYLLRRVTFLNEGVGGEIELLVATTDPRTTGSEWRSVAKRKVVSDQREQVIRFAATECRHIQIRFDIEQTGKVYGFGAFGVRRALEFIRQENEVTESALPSHGDGGIDLDEIGPLVELGALDWSATNSLGSSHVEMVSSSAQRDFSMSAKLVDEDSTTAYRFDPSDSTPTVVIDLGKVRDVGRVSAIYDRGARGQLKMWLADDQNYGGGPVTVTGDAYAAPVISDRRVGLFRAYEDTAGRGRMSFDRIQSTARYVVLQWSAEPVDRRADPPSKGFGISEIGVFEHRTAESGEKRQVRLGFTVGELGAESQASRPASYVPPLVRLKTVPTSR